MNKILDQLVEDKYGYSMRDSDSSTYEKTAGWEKEYVNGFMEEAKSGKYDFVFVCQTESVIDEMDRRKIPYIIVEPDNIVWNKQEAEERAKERQIPHCAGESSHRKYRERNTRWSYDITGSFTVTGIFMEGAFECI